MTSLKQRFLKEQLVDQNLLPQLMQLYYQLRQMQPALLKLQLLLKLELVKLIKVIQLVQLTLVIHLVPTSRLIHRQQH